MRLKEQETVSVKKAEGPLEDSLHQSTCTVNELKTLYDKNHSSFPPILQVPDNSLVTERNEL